MSNDMAHLRDRNGIVHIAAQLEGDGIDADADDFPDVVEIMAPTMNITYCEMDPTGKFLDDAYFSSEQLTLTRAAVTCVVCMGRKVRFDVTTP